MVITEKGINNLSGPNHEEAITQDNFFTIDRNHDNKKTDKSEINLFNTNSPQDLIDFGFQQIENNVKVELLEKLKIIDPYYFEKVILILLNKMGYGDFIETSKSSDGGIDGIINEDKLGLDRIYIQAKDLLKIKFEKKT